MRFSVTTRTGDDAPRTTDVSWFGTAELLAHTTGLVASVLRTGQTVVEVTGHGESAVADTRDLTQRDRDQATYGLIDHAGNGRGSMLRHLLGTPLTPGQRDTVAEPSVSTRAVGHAWVRHATGITDPQVPSYRASSARYVQSRESLSALATQAASVLWAPEHKGPAEPEPAPDVRTAAAAILTAADDRTERMLDHIHDVTLAHDTGTVDQAAAYALGQEVSARGREIDHEARQDHHARAITADTAIAVEGNDVERAAALLRLRDRAADAYATLTPGEREEHMRGEWTLPSVAGDGRRVDIQDYRAHVERQLAGMDPDTLAAARDARAEEVTGARTRYRFEGTDHRTGRVYTVETDPSGSVTHPSDVLVLAVDGDVRPVEWHPPEDLTGDPRTDVLIMRAAMVELAEWADPSTPLLGTGGMVYESSTGHQLRTDGQDVVEYRAPDADTWSPLPPAQPPYGMTDETFRAYAADLLAVEVPDLARGIEHDIAADLRPEGDEGPEPETGPDRAPDREREHIPDHEHDDIEL